MAEKVYMGLWDCSDCGKTGNLGTEKNCSRCNSPQNSVLTPSEDWYMSDQEITDPATLDEFDDGPSWNCGYCETLNNGSLQKCSHCDRPRDFDDTVNREVTYDDRVAHDPKPDTTAEMIESDIERAERAIATEASGPRKMKDIARPASELPRKGTDTEFYEKIRDDAYKAVDERIRINKLSPLLRLWETHRNVVFVAAGLVVALVLTGVIWGIVHTVNKYTATVPGTVTVSELHWERNVEVEEYKTLQDGGWSYPGDARVQGTESRIHHYETIHDGWRTEQYTDYETRYRTVSYTDMETRYRTVSYSGTCTRTVSGGNGSFRTETYSCPQTRQESYTVPVQKTKQESYQVPVQKTRRVEITHEEPRWAPWYYFEVDRWVTDRWVTASDAKYPAVIWPEPTDLSRNDQAGDQVGEERVGNERKEAYEVVYTDSQSKRHSDKKGYDVWSKLEKDETVPALYLQHNGELKSVDWNSVLQPAA